MTARSDLGRDPGLWRVLGDAAEAARLVWERGWAAGGAGNLSVDVSSLVGEMGGGVCLLVTAAGARMRDVARDPDRWCGVVRPGSGGPVEVLWGGGSERAFEPTSELPAHVRIHEVLRRNRPGSNALLHAHPRDLVALTHARDLLGEGVLERTLLRMHPEVALVLPAGVALVPYAPPGSERQGAAAAGAMESRDLAVWEKHGAIAAGRDLVGAFDLLDVANSAAALYLACRGAGVEPEGLDDSRLSELLRGRRTGPA